MTRLLSTLSIALFAAVLVLISALTLAAASSNPSVHPIPSLHGSDDPHCTGCCAGNEKDCSQLYNMTQGFCCNPTHSPHKPPSCCPMSSACVPTTMGFDCVKDPTGQLRWQQ